MPENLCDMGELELFPWLGQLVDVKEGLESQGDEVLDLGQEENGLPEELEGLLEKLKELLEELLEELKKELPDMFCQPVSREPKCVLTFSFHAEIDVFSISFIDMLMLNYFRSFTIFVAQSFVFLVSY